MKKLVSLLGILLLTNLGGCGAEHFLITDILFSLAEISKDDKDKTQISYTCTSTVKDRLVFVVSYDTKFVAQNSLGLGHACYALSLGRKIDNPLLEETFSLTFSKPFVYHGDTIAELTNVFEIENIRYEIDMYENNLAFCNSGADKVIDFSNEFFEKAIFDKSEHEVKFSCKTSDGLAFAKNILIEF